jgi:hypothetical protein
MDLNVDIVSLDLDQSFHGQRFLHLKCLQQEGQLPSLFNDQIAAARWRDAAADKSTTIPVPLVRSFWHWQTTTQ